MTAVYIDATPLDGSSNAFWPTPAFPISGPSLFAANTTPVVYGANTLTVQSSVTIPAPSLLTTGEIPSLLSPSLINAVTSATMPAPATITVVASATLGAPSLFTALSIVSVSSATALTVITSATVSAPTLITPIAGTSETPPYPLTHARILYDNLLLTSTVTATAGTTPNYTLIPNTYQSWLFTGTQSITFEMADQTSMDTVCISAHNLSGCTVTVTYDPLLAGSFVAFGTAKVVTQNKPLMFHLSSAVDVRRLKITVTGSGSRQVGSIYAGIALQMQRPFFSGFDRFGDSTTYSTPMTAGGNIIAREAIRKGYNNTFSFKHLSAGWVETYLTPFLLKAKTTPFVLAWNLSAYPDDVWFGATDSDINPTFMGIRDLYSVEWSMMSHGSV
jgi:hypothetical protein